VGKLMVGLAHVLALCAVLLVLPAIAASQPTPLPPGWYHNSGTSTIYEDSGLRIVWENSYVYEYPAESPLEPWQRFGERLNKIGHF
jgi:hypothetical protein